MQDNEKNQTREIPAETEITEITEITDNNNNYNNCNNCKPDNIKEPMPLILDDITGVSPEENLSEKFKKTARENINNKEYCPETKKALTTLQNLTGVIIHNINNLLAPFSLNMAKVEMYIESEKTEQLKKDLPNMVNSTELHLNAILESLRILYDNVSTDKSRIEYWDDVDIKAEMKARIEKIVKPDK